MRQPVARVHLRQPTRVCRVTEGAWPLTLLATNQRRSRVGCLSRPSLPRPTTVGDFCLPVCLYVRLSVCMRTCRTARPSFVHQIFCACYLWPWLGPSLAALRYVMYFRFYGWRHVMCREWPGMGDEIMTCTQTDPLWGRLCWNCRLVPY